MSTREYLEREKNVELDNFKELAKRQSIIGSYLFGRDAHDFLNEETLASKVGTSNTSISEKQDIPEEPIAKTTLERRIELKEMEEQRDDELIQMLCDYEGGFPLLLRRVKESMNSAKEAAAFLRKRALIEQEYASQLMKLASSSKSQVTKEKTKGHSYDTQWCEFEKMHFKIGEARMQFSTSILEMADNIQVLYKNTERSRKQLKESCNRQLKELNDAEANMERARMKFESTSEEWERTQGLDPLSSKKGSTGMKKSQSLTKGLNNLKQRFQQDFKLGYPKSEEEARQKATNANENYKTCLQQANFIRGQYFNNHLPRFVRALKETNADCDEGLSKYLVKYAKCVESLVMVEATMVSPLDANEAGLLGIIEKIDNHGDFNLFLHSNLGKERLINKMEHEYVSYLVKHFNAETACNKTNNANFDERSY
jgi:hypothetical protein